MSSLLRSVRASSSCVGGRLIGMSSRKARELVSSVINRLSSAGIVVVAACRYDLGAKDVEGAGVELTIMGFSGFGGPGYPGRCRYSKF